MLRGAPRPSLRYAIVGASAAQAMGLHRFHTRPGTGRMEPMSITCILVWAAVLLLLPLHVLLWATESRGQRIRRLRRQGQTWKAIAARYGVSERTVSRWAAA